MIALRRVGLALLAPLIAVVAAMIVTSLVVQLSGSPATDFWNVIFSRPANRLLVNIVNQSSLIYLSALAAAIGFRMNLFNIGVEGQYTLAALVAAYVGAVTPVPGPVRIALILIVAMLIGAGWSGAAAVLKVTRGVHEVISTIMLNFIAFGISAYLLRVYLKQPNLPGDFVVKTKLIPQSGQIPSLNPLLRGLGIHPPPGSQLYGFLPLALVIGILYYLLVNRTRFGYDLRATGVNPGAASASGVDAKAMIIKTMLISGAIAGLVGMPDLFGLYHRYTIDFVSGLGFSGIAVALVGRNNPFGIAFAALLFGFLDRSAQILDLYNIPKEITIIMRGVIILSVVIAYELVRRFVQAQEVRAAAERTAKLAEEAALEPA